MTDPRKEIPSLWKFRPRRLDEYIRNNLSGDYIALSRDEARELSECFDWHVRGVDMVRRMATHGAGPETSPEQALTAIRVWAENRLAKLDAWPPGPPSEQRKPKPQPDKGEFYS